MAHRPSGSFPSDRICDCDPQFIWAMPTGGVMSARATPASNPDGGLSLRALLDFVRRCWAKENQDDHCGKT